MSELKPCPFCKSDDIDAGFWASTDKVGPGCMNCGATAETVELWNTRTPDYATLAAASRELVEVMQWIDDIAVTYVHVESFSIYNENATAELDYVYIEAVKWKNKALAAVERIIGEGE